MFIVLFHLSFDQIPQELFKGRVRISFIPFTPSCNTNVSAVFPNKVLLDPGVSLELVPVGGDEPGEGVAGDHKGGGVQELVDVGQSPCPRPEDTMKFEEVLIIAGILDVGNKEPR